MSGRRKWIKDRCVGNVEVKNGGPIRGFTFPLSFATLSANSLQMPLAFIHLSTSPGFFSI